jgi:hypothetical protein
MATTSWVILLCNFNDNNTAPPNIGSYQRLFTTSGLGTNNMTAFFSDVSHGNLNLSGSQVFGLFTLPIPSSAYAGNVDVPPPGKYNREGLYDLAVQTARDKGVPIDNFFGIVVSTNVQTDLWGGGRHRAFCDLLRLQPSLLGQEMGHGYGLEHSRVDGSDEDYQDPWDIMSTAGAYMAPDANYTLIGPGLNAWNMRGRGWLDETRVWHSATDIFTGTSEATITLRPLHRRDLPGFLAAELPGGFLAEFRIKQKWDAGFEPAVFVHRFNDNQSYIMAATNGEYNLIVGNSFQAFVGMDVVKIDTTVPSATLLIYPLLGWSLAGNTAQFGHGINDGRPFWIGKFSQAQRDEVLFYYPGDDNWWLGRFTGTDLKWTPVSNTAQFGHGINDGRPFWIGNFTGSGQDDVLFYYPGDDNWWLGKVSHSMKIEVRHYQLRKDGTIWKKAGPSKGDWAEKDDNPDTVAIAAAGDNLYQLHKDGTIWKKTGPGKRGWAEQGDNPDTIAILAVL